MMILQIYYVVLRKYVVRTYRKINRKKKMFIFRKLNIFYFFKLRKQIRPHDRLASKWTFHWNRESVTQSQSIWKTLPNRICSDFISFFFHCCGFSNCDCMYKVQTIHVISYFVHMCTMYIHEWVKVCVPTAFGFCLTHREKHNRNEINIHSFVSIRIVYGFSVCQIDAGFFFFNLWPLVSICNIM